jgi:hypothetical protein
LIIVPDQKNKGDTMKLMKLCAGVIMLIPSFVQSIPPGAELKVSTEMRIPEGGICVGPAQCEVKIPVAPPVKKDDEKAPAVKKDNGKGPIVDVSA